MMPGNKKKRKRNKKKNKKKNKKISEVQQSTPPRVALADIFHDQVYPEGEKFDYEIKDENLERTTAEELRHLAAVTNMDDDFLRDYRKAAEIHRQVRQYAQTIAKPGISMTELAREIDDGVRALTGHQGLEKGDALKAGLAFPTGLCLNNIGAHWTPNTGAKEVILQYDDVLKIDFGVHVNGRIVDSAFTVAANPVYDPLLDAVRAATNIGLKVTSPLLIFPTLLTVVSGSRPRRPYLPHILHHPRGHGIL
jgi:methionyl aminopeptidase